MLRSKDLFLQSEVRAVDRPHVAAERARDFDARDHAGLRGFGGATLERGASQHNASDRARRRPPQTRGLGREGVLIRSARLGDPPGELLLMQRRVGRRADGLEGRGQRLGRVVQIIPHAARAGRELVARPPADVSG